MIVVAVHLALFLDGGVDDVAGVDGAERTLVEGSARVAEDLDRILVQVAERGRRDRGDVAEVMAVERRVRVVVIELDALLEEEEREVQTFGGLTLTLPQGRERVRSAPQVDAAVGLLLASVLGGVGAGADVGRVDLHPLAVGHTASTGALLVPVLEALVRLVGAVAVDVRDHVAVILEAAVEPQTPGLVLRSIAVVVTDVPELGGPGVLHRIVVVAVVASGVDSVVAVVVGVVVPLVELVAEEVAAAVRRAVCLDVAVDTVVRGRSVDLAPAVAVHEVAVAADRGAVDEQVVLGDGVGNHLAVLLPGNDAGQVEQRGAHEPVAEVEGGHVGHPDFRAGHANVERQAQLDGERVVHHRLSVTAQAVLVDPVLGDLRGAGVDGRVVVVAVVAAGHDVVVPVVVDVVVDRLGLDVRIRVRVGVRVGVGIGIRIGVRVRVAVRIGVRVGVGRVGPAGAGTGVAVRPTAGRSEGGVGGRRRGHGRDRGLRGDLERSALHAASGEECEEHGGLGGLGEVHGLLHCEHVSYFDPTLDRSVKCLN